MCTVWNLLDLEWDKTECARFGICLIWNVIKLNVLCLERAHFGMCKNKRFPLLNTLKL